MKRIIQLISAIFLFTGRLTAQKTTIAGAWHSKDGDDETVMICQADYILITEFNPVNTAFYYSSGGRYQVTKGRFIASLEFTTSKTEIREVKTKGQLQYSQSGDKLSITKDDTVTTSFSRIDNGQGALAGVWQLAGKHGELKKFAGFIGRPVPAYLF